MELKITGKYEVDNNFITVYTSDAMYTIPRTAPRNWGFRKIGSDFACGGKCTAEFLAEHAARCTKAGSFILEYEEGEL